MSTATLHTTHFTHLAGHLPSRVFELGPLPVDLPADIAHMVDAQLAEGGFVHGGGLSDLGAQLMHPLVEYTDAYWGMIVLHNEREQISLDIEDRWLDLLNKSLPLVPRIYFLAARRGDTVTLAVRNREQIDISQQTIVTSFADTAARTLLRLADPGNQWPIYPTDTISIPFTALAAAPARRPDTDSPDAAAAFRRASAAFTQGLRTQGIDGRTTAALSRLLDLDHVAATRVLYSRGPHRLTPEHAVTLDYLHDAGVAVSHPRLVGPDWWKTIKSATLANTVTALTQLATLPGHKREPIHTALAGNPRTQDDVLHGLLPDGVQPPPSPAS